ncbi:MAG TPA: MBL fold metallo-hydrolase [Solirubrobacteraceae bacterium]|nr:MBL fold metallo-hydrolase [Solirubrobacteraceae bacterium]
MRVSFCGVRGSTPAPGTNFVRYGGHTSCLAVSHDGAVAPALVLDAGAGLRKVTSMLAGAPFTGTILLSHLHWDHTLGLPFFAAADRADSQPTVLLPQQQSGADAVSVLAQVMCPPYFPVTPTQLRGEWTFDSVQPGEQQIEGFTVLALEIPHKGGRTFGYRISDARSTLTYMPDHCPTALGPGEHGYGEYHPDALQLAHDADLLVHDAQLLPEELAAEADFGHAVADYSVELARLAGTHTVALFHHRYTRTDDQLDQLGERLADDSPNVIVAAEDTVLEL